MPASNLEPVTSTSSPALPPTILFAGGGTGGHIFPNLAIHERLWSEADSGLVRSHFLLSNRDLDRDILARTGIPFTQLSVKPWSNKPWHWPAFLAALLQSKKQVEAIIDRENVKAIVITGGFVSGPAAMAARSRRIPLLLVNLDAVPGKANRRMAASARRLGHVFSAYDSPVLPEATRIGLPLRLSALAPSALAPSRQGAGPGATIPQPLNVSPLDVDAWAHTLPGGASATAAPNLEPATWNLELSPTRHTLLITGGSQGASSVNLAVLQLLRHREVQAAMKHWQILHITGPGKDQEIAAAYAELGIRAAVLPFCDEMGQAWGAATIAISRSGAGSVAEAWANAVPTIFLPYPFHKDDHQRLNAGPIVEAGGAILLKDLIDAKLNASQLAAPLLELICDEKRRDAMVARLKQTRPADGAEVVAKWVMKTLAEK